MADDSLTRALTEASETGRLHIHGQDLGSVPDEIRELTGLRELYLWGCGITEMPSWVGGLTSLEVLDLSENPLGAVPGSIRSLRKLRDLRLITVGIRELPGWIGELTSLEALSLTQNPLGCVPEPIRELAGLRELHLWNCEITEMPGWIGELESLEVLELTGNSLGLPEAVRGVPRLRELYLRASDIREVPRWISELTSLSILDIRENDHVPALAHISRLPSLKQLGLSQLERTVSDDTLSQLDTLEVLSISNRVNWTPIFAEPPSWIGNLHRLRCLDLRGNSVWSVPDNIRNLSQLTHLYLAGHRLERFPDVIGDLATLEVLDISAHYRLFNENSRWFPSINVGERQHHMPFMVVDGEVGDIRFLPVWLAERLTALRVLRVDAQYLRTLPLALPDSIEAIGIAGNEIEVFPPALLELPALKEIDLRNNKLSGLPGELVKMGGRLSYLGLGGNQLDISPEILAQSDNPHAILDYLSRTVAGPTRRLDEAKVLVVGEGSVGKTSLIKRLVAGDFSELESKTEGIDVTRWGVDIGGDQIRLNVWDFGGQEIMHATHQFFLTKRSLYLLVVDARQDEDQNRIEYWLKLIQSFSEHSPVVIVGNKTDQAVLDIDMRGLRSKYPNVIGICSVSCKTADGVGDVQQVVAHSIGQLPHVRDPLPKPFFDIKAKLETFDRDYLPYGDYIGLCRKHGLDRGPEQELLVGFLHDLGTVVCFRDDPRLADTHILNPRWVTGGVYRILNAHRAAQKKGLLDWDDINAILDIDDYPPERRAFIVDMMKKFELCFESDDRTFLIPDLLTKEEPDTGDWADALRFEIVYDVLPSSIISRLIVRMRAHVSKGTVWRTGVVLAMDQNRALVRGDREDRLIKIAVIGPPNGRRGLLTAIRSELRAIQRAVPGLVSKEQVPIPGHPDHWASYEHLLNLERAGVREWIPEGLTKTFTGAELLDGVEDPSERHATAKALGAMLTVLREASGPVVTTEQDAQQPQQQQPIEETTPQSPPAESVAADQVAPPREASSPPDNHSGDQEAQSLSTRPQRNDSLGSSQPPAGNGGRPWTHVEAIAFGKLLLAALVVFVGTFIVADRLVGTSAAVGLVTAAVGAMTMFGVLVLVPAKFVSEEGLIETMKGILRRR